MRHGRCRIPLLTLVTLLMFCAAALAQSTPLVFVTNFTAGQVLKIDPTANPATVTTIYSNRNSRPEGITYGPDGLLYVADPTNGAILRMTTSGQNVTTIYQASGTNPTGAQDPRFDALGNLYFNTKGASPSGVWQILGVAGSNSFGAPNHIYTASVPGEGLAFSNAGDLLVEQNLTNTSAQLVRIAASSIGISPSTTTFSVGSTAVGVARSSTDQVYVGTPTGIKGFNADGSAISNCSISFGANQVNFLRITAGDTIFAATQDATGTNGKLWKVQPLALNTICDGASAPTPQLVASLPSVRGTVPPAVGVAITPTSTDARTKGPFSVPQSWNFGAHSVTLDTEGQTCTLSVTATDDLPGNINRILPRGSTVITESGREGMGTRYHVDKLTCSATSSFIKIGAFLNSDFNYYPVVVKCEPSGCQPLQTSEFHVFSTLEGTPGDGYIGGSLGCCSDFYVVNVPPATNKTGNFCGVQSPLRPPTSPPAPAKAGSAIAVKFELVLQGTPCSGTDFITDAIAVISAEHCATGTGPGTGKDCLGDQHMNTNPTGSANDLPLFRYDFTNNIYLYNLQTKLPDGTPWPTGIYSVVITANDFKPQLVFIQLN